MGPRNVIAPGRCWGNRLGVETGSRPGCHQGRSVHGTFHAVQPAAPHRWPCRPPAAGCRRAGATGRWGAPTQCRRDAASRGRGGEINQPMNHIDAGRSQPWAGESAREAAGFEYDARAWQAQERNQAAASLGRGVREQGRRRAGRSRSMLPCGSSAVTPQLALALQVPGGVNRGDAL